MCLCAYAGYFRILYLIGDLIVASYSYSDIFFSLFTFRVWERFMEEAKGIDTKNVQMYLGLDRCNIPICACAPVTKELLGFFNKCGIEIIQLYGMTECGVSITNCRKHCRFGSVGQPITGTQVKINSDTREASALYTMCL